MKIPEWRSAFRALDVRNYRLFFIGQSLSLLGTWSQMMALSWLVWRLTNSAWWLGFIGFSTQIPVLFLGLIGGVVADRYNRLPLLITSQILCMCQAIILAFLVYFDIAELWHIIVLSLLLGVVYAFEFPLRYAFVMEMVGKDNLLNAVALNSAMIHSTRIIGPMLAGLIIGWRGESWCFAANAVSFIFLIVALLSLDRSKLFQGERDGATIKGSISEGLKYMWSKPTLWMTLLLVTIIGGVGLVYATLLPIFVDKVYNGTATELGWLMGSFGVGALAGSLFLARRQTSLGLHKLTLRASIIFSIFIIAFGQIENLYLALAILLFAGFFCTIIVSSANTILQYETPNQLRGRMMSLFTVSFFGLSPIAYAIGGGTAQIIGAPLTVTISGALCLVTGIFLSLYQKHV